MKQESILRIEGGGAIGASLSANEIAAAINKAFQRTDPYDKVVLTVKEGSIAFKRSEYPRGVTADSVKIRCRDKLCSHIEKRNPPLTRERLRRRMRT